MAEANNTQRYEICLKGRIDPKRADWLGASVMIILDTGNTLLNLEVSDQAALFGALNKIRDMGAFLISMKCLDF